MRVNVKGSLMGDGKILCRRCTRSTVIKTDRDSEVMYCHALERQINIRVYECDSYTHPSKMPLWKMEQIAYMIDTSSKKIGFLKPKDFREQFPEQKHEVVYTDPLADTLQDD